jgi:predicted dehydrogenase
MTNRKLRVGLMGCGQIGRVHCQRLVDDGRVELVAFFDVATAFAERLRDEFAPAAAVAPSVTAAFEQHALDAVVLATPTQVHYAQACAALERGVHVLCEKPLASNREEICDLIHRRRATGLVLSVAYQRRYQAPYVTARRELKERTERYGAVRQIHVFVCERWQQTIAGTWRDDPAVGSGYFGDAGSHQVDTCWFVTGLAPTAVWAQSDKRGAAVEIVTIVQAQLSNGAGMAAHFVGDAHHWREDIHFHCEKADLLLRNERLFRCADNKVEEIVDLVPGSTPNRAFVDRILDRADGRDAKDTASPPECALPMVDWTAAVLASARENRWVNLPVVTANA